MPRLIAQTTAVRSTPAPSAPVMTVTTPQSPTGYGPFDTVVGTLQQIAQAAGAAAGSSGSSTLQRIAQAANQAATDIADAVQTIDGSVIYGGVAPTPAAASATLMQQLRTFIGTPEGKIVAALGGLWLARKVLR